MFILKKHSRRSNGGFQDSRCESCGNFKHQISYSNKNIDIVFSKENVILSVKTEKILRGPF